MSIKKAKSSYLRAKNTLKHVSPLNYIYLHTLGYYNHDDSSEFTLKLNNLEYMWIRVLSTNYFAVIVSIAFVSNKLKVCINPSTSRASDAHSRENISSVICELTCLFYNPQIQVSHFI